MSRKPADPEAKNHRILSPDQLDPILFEWVRIGSVAWSGHLSSGRGVVLVTVTEEGAWFDYWAGIPCSCHARWVETYCPEEEAIVLVRRGEKESIYRIKALPPPREAWKLDRPEGGGRLH